MPIEDDSDIGRCRRKAATFAGIAGFDDVKTGEVAIIVTELVSNEIRHGGGRGLLFIQEVTGTNYQKGLEFFCFDTGNGIPDLSRSLMDGFSRKDSLGIGLGTINRFSDEFEVNPDLLTENQIPDHLKKAYSHCIRTLKWVPQIKWTGINKNLTIGAVSRSKPGEVMNGDAYIINHLAGNLTLVAVIDGLGHGREAFYASDLIREKLAGKADLPLDILINQAHMASRGTRGVVMAVLKADTGKNKLWYAGIGNIEGFLLQKNSRKSLVSFGGIVGHNIRNPRVFEYDFFRGDLVCLYSDGISSRWKEDELNWNEHPQKNAEYIVDHYARQNDDATVVILSHLF